MLTTAEKLDTLTRLGIELNQVADLDMMMEHILSQARRFVGADAGSIYIRDRDRLRFSYTQNATLERRLPPGGKLIYSTFSIPIDTNSISGYATHEARSLNIADVYEIDPAQPFHFSRQFDQATGYRTQSMLTVPLKTSRNEVIGVLQIINAQDEHGRIRPFSTEDEQMLFHFASTATVALERARMTRAMILRTIRLAEMRDPKETGAHVNRVGTYAVEIYEHWAHKQAVDRQRINEQRDILRMAAMLHDVGKVGVSDTILKKPGPFTPQEYEIMKEHTVMGGRLFLDKQSAFDDAASDVALTHHERWDGKGYPGYVDIASGKPLAGHATSEGRAQGRQGEDIPLFGRIVAIADVFDALCSRRVYKPAWDEKDALKVMEQGAGTQFDLELIEAFFACLDILRSVRDRYPDEIETAQTPPTTTTPNI